jgi:hypothetical protein
MANETMVLLEKIVVPAAGASSVTFTSIPQSYTDLQITMSSRVDAANGVAQLYFNGSTASDKRWLRVYGDGSSAVSGNSSGLSAYFRPIGMNRSDQTASVFGNMSIYIPNYTSSSTYKSMSADGVNENNATFAEAALNAGLWESNSAITSITIIPSAGNFVQYSTFYLYGVAKQGVTPTNAPAATGGDSIVFDGTYWIHTFYSSGTFTPKKALTCDYLVVAGGGGGGKNWAGGAGAGGYRYITNQSLTANTNYTATVGAGGAGATTTTALNSGSNSSFNSTSATGGGAGGNNQASPASGGSGGGGAYTGEAGVSTNGAAGNAGSYSPVEGYAGGNGYLSPGNVRNSAAGGGGSSAVGGNSVLDASGAGGAGTANSISGSSVTYAGGGGGGGYTPTGTYPAGAGGSGGGGAGGQGNGTVGGSGTANRGGGGGGGAGGNGNGGAGGSGIVIVRYAA